MANIDRLINCQISLNTTGVTTQGFSTLLVCTVNEKLTSRVTAFTSITELTELEIGSDEPIYRALTAAFSQIPRPRVIKVGKCVEKTLDNDGEQVTIVDVAETMKEICAVDNDFYGVAITEKDENVVMDMADWCEANTKLFVTSTSNEDVLDPENTSDIASRLMNGNYFRTAIWYHEDNTQYVECAVAARCFAILAGGETWANKRLANIVVDKLTETNYNTCKNKNCNTFEKFRNVSITQIGKVSAGEWIDVIRFRDWLLEEIQTTEFAMLINLDKLPYTDEGIALIENKLNQCLALGQKRGGIAPTEFDENGDPNYGYVISVPKASSIDANKKASRVLDDVKFTARLAGAIHAVNINGSLTYENISA